MDSNSFETKYYPLTHAQKRIWYHEKINPGTSVYNIGGIVRMGGQLNLEVLREAIDYFVKKNDGLCLCFREQEEEITQYAKEFPPLQIALFDFSKGSEPEKDFEKWLEQEMAKPFVIERSPLFYFAAFKLSDYDQGFLTKFHHIVMDGWSVEIMANQIQDFYRRILKGEKIGSDVEHSYMVCIDKERNYLSSERFIKDRLFWGDRFKSIPPSIIPDLSFDFSGRRKTFPLEEKLSGEIKEYVGKRKCSLNTFFTALLLIYLKKTTQKEDLVVGMPVMNRAGKEERNTVGMLTSTLPFRMLLEDGITFDDLAEQVNREIFKCYKHMKYPYELLLQDLQLKKQGRDGLFEISINYYHTSLIKELGGLPMNVTEIYNGKQPYPIQWIIQEWSDNCFTFNFDYKVNLFTDKKIEEMYHRLVLLTRQVLEDSSRTVGELRLLSNEEYNGFIYGFNATLTDYPRGKTVCGFFEEQAEITPDKVAVSDGEQELKFCELNEKASRLAGFLRQKGVGRGAVVGLMTYHSIETVVGILGVLKAGGAYLPVDPDYPIERIGFMLEDCGISILLSNCGIRPEIAFKGEVINLASPSAYESDQPIYISMSLPSDLVYLIYTSGSTGKPKGTMIEHQGLMNYIWWARKVYTTGEEDAFPLYSSLSFDLTVTSIFIPLISGNRIVVYRDDGDEFVLYRIMRENMVRIIKLTPSHLSLLKDLDNTRSSVRRFIVGGEDLKVSLAESIHHSFGGNIEIFNEYGPTETVVGCMIHKYDIETDKGASVPIGIPADNVQIYILDPYMNPVPEGVLGEMYISGDGVARGYLNRPELTRERFVDNPFVKGTHMYKTGDMAKFTKGKIEYIGRIDHQIKIRGHRIELGEIEKFIQEYRSVKEAVVIDLDDESGAKYLCAYVTAGENFTVQGLIEHLSAFLPQYMLPRSCIALDKIPLTLNGKVDRTKLPKPQLEKAGKTNFVGARNPSEQALLDAIASHVDIRGIGMKDNFYQIGGDSIKAIQISARLKGCGYKIKIKDILSHPVLEEMALHMEVAVEEEKDDQGICKGDIQPTPIVSWFFSQGFDRINHYNQSLLLKIGKELTREELEWVMEELVKHHDALRINYSREKSTLFYNNALLDEKCTVEEYDLSDLEYEEQCIKIKHLGESLKSSFNIEYGVMIKACLFSLGKEEKRVLFTAHHLVVDGVSWRILLEDIESLLEARRTGKAPVLPRKTCSYQKWALELGKYSITKAIKQKNYWESIEAVGFNLSKASAPPSKAFGGKIETCWSLSEVETGMLLFEANSAYNTEPVELMIAALTFAVQEYLQQNEIVIELESHGRVEISDEIDLSRTVGWFTSLFPFALKYKGESLEVGIKSIKEQFKSVPDNGLGYGVLKYVLKQNSGNNCKAIRFNYLGNIDANFKNNMFEYSHEESGVESGNPMTSLAEINAVVIGKEFNARFQCSKEYFDEQEANTFAELYAANLKKVIHHCYSSTFTQPTPSDFELCGLSQEELDDLFA